MEQLHRLFDAAGRVVLAAEEHQEMADKAIKNINSAVSKLELRAEALRGQIQQEVKNSLESSVSRAVDDLIKKFQVADKYADQAARRYEQAVHDANQRVFDRVCKISTAIILSFIVGLVVGKYLLG